MSQLRAQGTSLATLLLPIGSSRSGPISKPDTST
jgi:hypothetical protein